jgi:hypothetical protein
MQPQGQQSNWEREGLISRKAGLWLLVVITAILVLFVFTLPRIPLPQWYHAFADQRACLGIPNFGNVVSNVPFAIAGVWGLLFLLRLDSEDLSRHFVSRKERWPYLTLFAGLVLVAFGSSYYHLHPDNARLAWDQLPMTIVFMSLVAALIVERISLRAGLWLLPVLLLVGAGSVLQWYWSEVRGVGDLRFYATVQAYSVLFLLLALLLPPRYTRGRDLMVIAGLYVLAKVFETFDRTIFRWGEVVSGHTLKHLVAAIAGYWILRMLKRRHPNAMQASIAANGPNRRAML